MQQLFIDSMKGLPSLSDKPRETPQQVYAQVLPFIS